MKTLILITLLITANIVKASDIKDCDKSPEYYRSNEKQYSIEDDDMDSIVITDTTTGDLCIID